MQNSSPHRGGLFFLRRAVNQQEWRRRLVDYMGKAAFSPAKIKDLARALDLPAHQYRPFRALVREMESEGHLVRLRHGRFALPARRANATGSMRLHRRGFGFVLGQGRNPDIYVGPGQMGEAADGDEVEVEILVDQGRMGGPEGRVVEVLRQSPRQAVGRFYSRGRRAWVELEGPSPRSVTVAAEPDQGIGEGHLVAVELAPGQSGVVTRVLGDPDEPRLDFTLLAARFGLEPEFPPLVQEEVVQLPQAPPIEEGRRDLRPWTTFTIDPPGARDFDDALSVESRAEGGYRLGVHIADVSYFVRPGTALDREAARRGTSAYLLDRVVHMLPEALASGLCTLVPDQDRLTFSLLLDVDGQGRVVAGELVEAVIRSRARLNYDQVQAFFDGGTDCGQAADLARPLDSLLQLSQLLRRGRHHRGALDFDLPEARVELDAEGRPTALGRAPRWASHRLVEECMLAANEWIGRWCQERDIPVLYRVHAPPDPQKLEAWAGRMASLGLEAGGKAATDQRFIQDLLAQTAGRADAFLFEQLLLRAMMRAEYAPEDKGHFGLACPHYLHFTSPIRRYPDLLVHRLIKEAHHGRLDRAAWTGKLPALGTQLSRLERQAEAAERAYIRRKQMRYMAGYLGQVFAGRVTGVVNSGFFVEVGDWAVEGFCALRDLGDYYEYEEDLLGLWGRTGGRRIELGTQVEVTVARVDVDNQRLDLQVDEAALPRSGRPAGQRKGKGRGGKKTKGHSRQRRRPGLKSGRRQRL